MAEVLVTLFVIIVLLSNSLQTFTFVLLIKLTYVLTT